MSAHWDADIFFYKWEICRHICQHIFRMPKNMLTYSDADIYANRLRCWHMTTYVGIICRYLDCESSWILPTDNQWITLRFLSAHCPYPIHFVRYLSTTCLVPLRFISVHIRQSSVCVSQVYHVDGYLMDKTIDKTEFFRKYTIRVLYEEWIV